MDINHLVLVLQHSHGPGWYLEVDPKGEGERLDRFIARRLPRVSRSRAAKLDSWLVNLHNASLYEKLKKSNRLKSGTHIWIKRPLPSEDMSTLVPPTILDECEDFIVINKPPGWIAHPTASRYQSALTTWLRAQGLKARPVHRLDLETSGILLCLKNGRYEKEIQHLFATQKVCKQYLSINRIDHHNSSQRLKKTWQETRSLGFDLNSRIGIKMGQGSLKAVTDFNIIATWNDSTLRSFALISAQPHTGRQHQIRIHLALNELSILGDKLYGVDESYFLKHLNHQLNEQDYLHLGHSRQALHASHLSLPWQGKIRQWSCPLALDLKRIIPTDTLKILNAYCESEL